MVYNMTRMGTKNFPFKLKYTPEDYPFLFQTKRVEYRTILSIFGKVLYVSSRDGLYTLILAKTSSSEIYKLVYGPNDT